MLENTKSNGTRMGRTLRAHPVAIALIGAECGWLAISATGAGERIRRGASDMGTQAKVWTGQLRDRFRDRAARSSTALKADVTEAGSRAYAREKSRWTGRAKAALAEDAPLQASGRAAKAMAHRTAEDGSSINGRLADARERFSEVVESHPIMTLALAVLAGAAVGLALPTSEKKHESDGQIGSA